MENLLGLGLGLIPLPSLLGVPMTILVHGCSTACSIVTSLCRPKVHTRSNYGKHLLILAHDSMSLVEESFWTSSIQGSFYFLEFYNTNSTSLKHIRTSHLARMFLICSIVTCRTDRKPMPSSPMGTIYVGVVKNQ